MQHLPAVVDAAVDDRALEPVHRADELGDERRRGRAVHLRGRAHLLDAAAVHHRDVVGDRERLFLVVRDVERRDPELELDAPDLLAQLHAHLCVERRERLVEEQHARLDRERARERDALLHAAGELMRIAVARVPEADELEQLARRASRRSALSRPRIFKPYSTFCRAVMFGKSEYAWKTMPMSRLFGGDARDVLAVDDDPARVGAVEAGDEPQRRRLAAARRPEQREELALAELDLDAVERLHGAEVAVEVLQFEVGHQRAPAITALRGATFTSDERAATASPPR